MLEPDPTDDEESEILEQTKGSKKLKHATEHKPSTRVYDIYISIHLYSEILYDAVQGSK